MRFFAERRILYENITQTSRYFRQGMGVTGTALTWTGRQLGWSCQRQSAVYKAVFWIMRTGAPWRDLPPDYGDWSDTHRRFIRWRDKGVWEELLEILIDEPDYEWLMIDASHCKVHPHAAGAKGGNQDMSRTKGGSTQNCIWPWIRMVCRSGLLLQKVQQQIVRK